MREIKSKEDLINTVDEIGFLPFFCNAVNGFSLEENISQDQWYQGRWKGKINWPAWEWKGDVANSSDLIYGKLFAKKAGFVSRKWYPDLCNYRRDGYDFDDRYEEGLASYKDKEIYDFLRQHGACLSKEIKGNLGYRKGEKMGFDTSITRLQMQTYVTVADFEYQIDRNGSEYGWAVARYAISEEWLSEDLSYVKGRSPQESYERIMKHMSRILPRREDQVAKLIK